jgi:replicative DNA helicase
MSDQPIDLSDLTMFPTIKSFDQRFRHERKHRLEMGKECLSFGVSFLDDALGGIYANDLIVLGAPTGVGKTQMATLIAKSNAEKGKRVLYFALEAEEYEIERRIKYQMICERYYSMCDRPNIYLNYMDWYYGKLNSALSQIEEELESIDKVYSTLSVYYRDNEFNEKEFQRIFLSLKSEFDLVIIDHLHYFDYDDDNENRAVRSIVKAVRDTAQIAGKPVILISHIRKSDRRAKRLVPAIEDFHGSSDIGKIATKAITFAPNFEANEPNGRQTYVSVTKCRVDGTRMRAIGLLMFNYTSQRYEHPYYVGKLNADETEYVACDPFQLPKWATNAIREMR